jgi:hypothetical protein
MKRYYQNIRRLSRTIISLSRVQIKYSVNCTMLKNIYSTVLLLALFITTACHKEEDENPNLKLLLGNWEMIDAKGEKLPDGSYEVDYACCISNWDYLHLDDRSVTVAFLQDYTYSSVTNLSGTESVNDGFWELKSNTVFLDIYKDGLETRSEYLEIISITSESLFVGAYMNAIVGDKMEKIFLGNLEFSKI